MKTKVKIKKYEDEIARKKNYIDAKPEIIIVHRLPRNEENIETRQMI